MPEASFGKSRGLGVTTARAESCEVSSACKIGTKARRVLGRIGSDRAYPWPLHVADSLQHGGLRVVGLLTWQLRAPTGSVL